MHYTVGDVKIDEDGFELCRKGVRVTVEPRVLEFILHLIRNRARLVTKDELLEALWRSFVVDSVITRCACLARKTLGDPSLIRTVYGRGYRWSAPDMSVGGTRIGREAKHREDLTMP